MLQKSVANSMYFKLDYLELLGKHWLLNRAPMLGDWRRSAGLERRWIGAAEIAWRVASDARKDGATTGVFFLSARVCLSWLRGDSFRNRKRGICGWRRKRCNSAVTGNCWPGLIQPKWTYWLAWASSIIGSQDS
jgi:hypothetical protein